MVFLLEVSPECRQATVALLQAHDFECQTFTAVEEAVRALPQAVFPSVVADFHLATQVLDQIHAINLDVPVIVISPDNEPAKRETMLTAGAAMYLEKPYPPEALLDYLDSLTVKRNAP